MFRSSPFLRVDFPVAPARRGARPGGGRGGGGEGNRRTGVGMPGGNRGATGQGRPGGRRRPGEDVRAGGRSDAPPRGGGPQPAVRAPGLRRRAGRGPSGAFGPGPAADRGRTRTGGDAGAARGGSNQGRGEAGRGRVFDRLDDGEGRHQTPQMQQLTRTSRPMCIRIVHRGYGGEGRLTAHPRAVDAPKRGPRATRYQRVAPVRRRSGAGARAPRPAPSGTRASMPRPNRAFFPPTRSRRYPSR